MTVTDTTTEIRFLEVDPRHLQVNPANVRRKSKGIDDLAASIAKVGVQVPLTVRANGSGDTFVIVAGERRALAAVKAGVATVPVIVRPYDDDGQAELTTMLVENLHREGLTPADEARGFEQLAAFGLPIEDIAQLTGRDTKRVSSGLAVAKSEKVADVAAKHDLTLEQLAAIAEVEDDEDDVAELVSTAEDDPEYFDQRLATMRLERKRRAERQEVVDKLTADGVTIINKSPGYSGGSSATRLDQLVDAKGKKLTPAGHKKCPGHCAYVPDRGYGDRKPVLACSNPKKNGHEPLHKRSTPAKRGAPSAAAQKKDAEAKARREEDEQLLEAATSVRRKFVRELLAHKTAPKGLLGFVVPLIIEFDLYAVNVHDGIVTELTGAKSSAKRPTVTNLLVELTSNATDGRLQVLLLAWIACTLESDWQPYLLEPAASYQSNEAEARYLQFLASCGYRLADIEQRIVDTAAEKSPKAKK